jgi:hypothetical protein
MLVFLTQSANFVKKFRKKNGDLPWIMDHTQWFIIQLMYYNILLKCDKNEVDLCDGCKRLCGDCENPSPLHCSCTNSYKEFQLCDECKRKIGKVPQWVMKRIHYYLNLRADLNYMEDGKIAISSHPFEFN